MKRCIVFVALSLLALLGLAGGRAVDAPAGATAAAPAARAQAALVVGTGPDQALIVAEHPAFGNKRACVRFSGSISALEALRMTGWPVRTETFPGQGTAVCAICGEGCSSGSCFNCDGQAESWSYWTAADGDDGFSFATRGVSNRRLSDGDVEGWSWTAQRRPPTFATVENVCVSTPTSEPSTTTTRAPRSTAAPASPDPAPTTRPRAPAPTGVEPRSPAPSATAPASLPATDSSTVPPATVGGSDPSTSAAPTETTPAPRGGETGTRGDENAVGDGPDDDAAADQIAAGDTAEESSNPVGLAVAAVLLVALGGWTVVLRRRR